MDSILLWGLEIFDYILSDDSLQHLSLRIKFVASKTQNSLQLPCTLIIRTEIRTKI